MTSTNPMPAQSVQALIAAGGALAEPATFSLDDAPAALTAVVPDGYRLETAYLASNLDPHRPAPRRTRSRVKLDDIASWVLYLSRHGANETSTEVYATIPSRITAILDAPSEGRPAWGDHRAEILLTRSEAWLSVTAASGQMRSQDAFAEWIEDRSAEIVSPDAATMLEVAQSIQAATSVQFEAGFRVRDGQRVMAYRETTEAKAGSRGELEVPQTIGLRVQVWEHLPIAVPLTARLRTRTGAQGLTLGIVVDQLEAALEAAWDALVLDVQSELSDAGINCEVMSGTAPSYA